MPKLNYKTVTLYNKRRVTVETIEKIVKAKDGELIAVEPDELQHFVGLMIRTGSLEEALPPKPKAAKAAATADDLKAIEPL